MKSYFSVSIIFLFLSIFAFSFESKANELVKITVHFIDGKSLPIEVSATNMLGAIAENSSQRSLSKNYFAHRQTQKLLLCKN